MRPLTNREPTPESGGTMTRLVALTVLAIIYESLIPFEYRSVPLDQAIAKFLHLTWEPLGAAGRGDWIGNIILYMPLGFFAAGAVRGRSQLAAFAFNVALGVVLAVAVEFAQTWADPRTVRLNDIVAEILGSVFGATAWLLFGARLTRAFRSALLGGVSGLRAALSLYVLAYVFFALFPFDFPLSTQEIQLKASNPDAVVLIPHDLLSLSTLVRLSLRAALMLPLGAAIRVGWRSGVAIAVVSAGLLSTAIEIGHWFEFSAQSDIANIFVAVAGAAAGNILATSRLMNDPSVIVWLRSSALAFGIAYLLALPILRGWRPHLANRSVVDDTLANLHWMPLYYHYFTSKTRALVSFLTVATSFAPVGVLSWAIRLRDPLSAGETRGVWMTAFAAGLLSAVIEAGALLTVGSRPDPTNVLIAMAAAVLAQRVCEWIARIVWRAPGSDYVPT